MDGPGWWAYLASEWESEKALMRTNMEPGVMNGSGRDLFSLPSCRCSDGLDLTDNESRMSMKLL